MSLPTPLSPPSSTVELRRRYALDRGQHLLHLGAAADDVLEFVALAQRLAQRAILLAQAVDFEFLARR